MSLLGGTLASQLRRYACFSMPFVITRSTSSENPSMMPGRAPPAIAGARYKKETGATGVPTFDLRHRPAASDSVSKVMLSPNQPFFDIGFIFQRITFMMTTIKATAAEDTQNPMLRPSHSVVPNISIQI